MSYFFKVQFSNFSLVIVSCFSQFTNLVVRFQVCLYMTSTSKRNSTIQQRSVISNSRDCKKQQQYIYSSTQQCEHSIYIYSIYLVQQTQQQNGSRCVRCCCCKGLYSFLFFLFPISYPLDSEMPMEQQYWSRRNPRMQQWW